MDLTASLSAVPVSLPPITNNNIVHQLLNSSDITSLTRLAAISDSNAKEVSQSLQRRIDILAAPFFPNGTVLREILRSCDAAISGSSALHLLLPASSTTWTPNDLDLYVPHRYMKKFTARLHHFGYQPLARNPRNHSNYSSSHILNIHKFLRGDITIDVIESRTDASFSPIFQFHSTALMNFIGADTIFSAYPDLTMNYKSLLNPYSIYRHTYTRNKLAHLEKYRLRGFNFIPCQDSHTSRLECRSIARSITDTGCLWVDINTGLRTVQTPANIFHQYGIVDLEWRLGGHICESDCFLRPRLRVIEDKSYVLLIFCILTSSLIRSTLVPTFIHFDSYKVPHFDRI